MYEHQSICDYISMYGYFIITRITVTYKVNIYI